MRRIAFALLVVLLVAEVPAQAGHQAGHDRPAGPAVAHFPDGFGVLTDSEFGWRIGGFGGSKQERTDRYPIVFVHGNNSDHATWFLVADQMTRALGWGHGDMFALSYIGVGCTNDGALVYPNTGYRGWTYQQDRASSTGCVISSNDVNVADLKAFIEAVLSYTGADKVHIVSHSLGVTVARKTLFVHPFLRDKVAGFVAIAGGNHGTSLCPPGSEGRLNSCDEIALATPWLAELNGAGEAPGPTRWMTVYDGTGAGDPAFAGPAYAQSPRLEGALNVQFPGQYHNDLRVKPEIVKQYSDFLLAIEKSIRQQAELARRTTPEPSRQTAGPNPTPARTLAPSR